jgi:hypothetical protein
MGQNYVLFRMAKGSIDDRRTRIASPDLPRVMALYGDESLGELRTSGVGNQVGWEGMLIICDRWPVLLEVYSLNFPEQIGLRKSIILS